MCVSFSDPEEVPMVSILVLVEGTLQFGANSLFDASDSSFNPCFSGRYSAIINIAVTAASCVSSFNPCFSGRYSAIENAH